MASEQEIAEEAGRISGSWMPGQRRLSADEVLATAAATVRRREFVQSVCEALPKLRVDVHLGELGTHYTNSVVTHVAELYTDGVVTEGNCRPPHDKEDHLQVAIEGASHIFCWEMYCVNPGEPPHFFSQMVNLTVFLPADAVQDADLVQKVVAAVQATITPERLVHTDSDTVQTALKQAVDARKAAMFAQRDTVLAVDDAAASAPVADVDIAAK